jgi:O-antigen/teichoic acid export membrane protein
LYLIWIALGIALLTDHALHLLADQSYWSAAEITPPLLLSLLLASAVGFCNFSFLYSGKTSYMAKGSWLSAIALTIGFVFLVPSWGALGAAWSRVIAGMCLLGVTVYWSRSVYPMRLPWLRVFIILGLGVTLYLTIAFLQVNEVTSIVLSFIMLVLFPIVIVFSPILPPRPRAVILEHVSRLLSHVSSRLKVSSKNSRCGKYFLKK